jgi:O-antigen ligase
MTKRATILCVMACLGLAVFYSQRVQQKMFFSGHGTLADIRRDNEDFRTTGRSTMWDKMIPEIEEMPLLGHGANASEPFVSRLTGGLTHPHNDWLRLLFDYGYVGAAVFAFCLLMQTAHAYVNAKRTVGEVSIFFYAGASSFLSFFLFMFTDNIILYAAFFGNLQFTILGLAYAATYVQGSNLVQARKLTDE